MKIRTKIYTTTAVSVGLLIVVGVILFSSSQQASLVAEKAAMSGKIVKEVFELANLESEYILYGVERARHQWQSKYNALGKLFQSSPFQFEEEEELWLSALQEYKALKPLFLQLVRLQENRSKPQPTSREGEASLPFLQQQVTSQLWLKSQILVSSLSSLSQKYFAQRAVARQQADWLFIVLMVSLTLFFSTMSIWIYGTFAKRLTALHHGVERIGGGDLEYRVGEKAGDELGQLSVAFDQMVGHLKEITASRDELNQEIDQREKAEQQIQKKTEELARSNQELEQFAYVASHDLQEPLRMVASFTELLKKKYGEKLDKEAEEYIGFAVDGAKRMQTLIQDLLEFSRIGRWGRVTKKIQTEECLAKALANLKIAIDESAAEITHDSLPEVLADERQFTQLLQNLIGNAIKYGKKGEKPKIYVGLKEGTFFVKDNGIGIDPKYYNRIFQIFQRLHGRGEYTGTGIGLALCKKIVENHGGRLWVESEPGRGSTFFFSFP